MTPLQHLIAIPLRRIRNTLTRPGLASWPRAAFLAVAGAAMLGCVFGLLRLVFAYFDRQPVIGPLLVSRMFSMAFLTFLFMLLYSNIMASLSSHFISKDLPLLMALPVSPAAVFAAKAAEALAGSSWMVVMMSVPLLGAFGAVRHPPAVFYAFAGFALVPFLLVPAALGMAANLGLLRLFPARRMREAMLLVGTAMFAAGGVTFRMLQPEKLVNLHDEMQVLEFMRTLAAPAAPWLPSAWLASATVAATHVSRDPLAYWEPAGLLWGVAAVLWAGCLWLAAGAYRGAWQRAAESLGVRRGVRLAGRWLPRTAGPAAAVMLKDLKVFMREPAQWGQVLLLASLIMIYVFNISRVPSEVAQGLKSLLFFLNLGFIGLILTAVAARFLFPQVSLEGGSFAVLRASPLDMRVYVRARWMAGAVPLLVLGGCLVGFTVPLLGVDRYMAWSAAMALLAMTLAVSALAVGCGAVFAKFTVSNPEEIVTSAGGFAFMTGSLGSVALVLLALSQPVRIHYYAALFRRPDASFWPTAAAWTFLAAATAGGVVGCVRTGARALERREL